MPQQLPTQNSSFLTKLPRELRDMIYEQVFVGDSEIVIPHPLMQTSKQMREEVAEAAARNIGLRARLVFIPNLKFPLKTVIQMEDPNDPRRYIPIQAHTDGRLRPYHLVNTEWQELCCSDFGKRLIPYVRHIWLNMSMADLQDITIKFKRDSAPEIITKEGDKYNSRDIRSVERYGMFQAIADKFQKEKAVCSVEWVNAFMEDILDARETVRLCKENGVRR